MNRLGTRHLLLYTALYCGFAALIHFPGIADYLFLHDGRQKLIVDTALSSPALTLQILTYALTVLLINLLPLALLLASMRAGVWRRPFLGLSAHAYFALAVVALWLAILAFNKLYFPRSSFAVLLPVEDTAWLWSLGAAALAVYAGLAIAPVLWRLNGHLIGFIRQPVARAALGTFLVLGMMQPLYSRWSAPAAPSAQPDIIIIGLDSLTPLHLQKHPGALPVLERLLAESRQFTNNLTPLARTFPAWTSILTAQYPVHSGARFNLTPFEQVETAATLPRFLKAQGYTTIYAQDERQFNNIDESFGFDTTVGPRPGAADFVLSRAADHPLANLALLTPWAENLFPYVALNRAAHVHYDPDEFVAAIADRIPEDPGQPLFLATHFCLAHYPYTWRDAASQPRSDVKTGGVVERQHIHALKSVERQIDGLIQALKQRGRLDNAILVILSDHGESLGYPDAHWASPQRHLNPDDTYERNGYSAFPAVIGFSGHGTDTLDRTQYQSLLAFRGYGKLQARFAPGTDDRLSALTDVMPTLLSALGLPPPADIDGQDLLADRPSANSRLVPTETGIRFGSLDSVVSIDEVTVLKESQKYYVVEPTSARLILRPEHYAELVTRKDIAIHTDEWLLALLRKDKNPVFPRVALLVHKPSGAWTLGGDAALIRRAPLAALTQGLRQSYGRELADFESRWPFTPAGTVDREARLARNATLAPLER